MLNKIIKSNNMQQTNLLSKITRRIAPLGLLSVVLALGLMFVYNKVQAGIGVGVAPDFPATVSVGQTNVPGTLNITNNSTSDVGTISLTEILMTPSCGDLSVPCNTGMSDPGVFSVDSPATGSGACVGKTFTVSIVDATTGRVHFVPDSKVDLSLGATCVINFTFDVLGVPTKDADATEGIQTVQGARVYAVNKNGPPLPSYGAGTDITTVQASKIIIEKQTLPDGDMQSFEFDPSWSGTNFNLKDGQQHTSVFLAPGTYSVAETSLSGWNQTSATCSDGSPVTAIALGAGETVTCVFTNTKSGQIIVDKVTDPSGSNQSFTFNTTGTGYSGFSLTDQATPNSQAVAPGTYSVTEAMPTGWTQTSATCSDGSPITAIQVGAGETVTCTFTNTQQKGHIIVDKVTDPTGNTQSFTFTTTGTGYTGFSLTDSGAPNNQTLNTGTYSVAETMMSGWTQTNVICTSSIDDTENAGSLELDPGETITCTFFNKMEVSQGCSPGYWKQPQHFGSYPTEMGIYPNTLFVDVFGEDAFPGMTLLQVLSQGGGGLNALGRQIVSAYLNAASIENYPYDPDEVAADFRDVYPGGNYSALMEKYEDLQDPCPLSRNPGPAGPTSSDSSIVSTSPGIVDVSKLDSVSATEETPVIEDTQTLDTLPIIQADMPKSDNPVVGDNKNGKNSYNGKKN